MWTEVEETVTEEVEKEFEGWREFAEEDYEKGVEAVRARRAEKRAVARAIKDMSDPTWRERRRRWARESARRKRAAVAPTKKRKRVSARKRPKKVGKKVHLVTNRLSSHRQKDRDRKKRNSKPKEKKK